MFGKETQGSKWLASFNVPADDRCLPGRGLSYRGGQGRNCTSKGKLQAETKDLKEDARNQVHWLWDELELARSENIWLWEDSERLITNGWRGVLQSRAEGPTG